MSTFQRSILVRLLFNLNLIFLLLLLIIIIIIVAVDGIGRPCPCSNPAWCEPIGGPPIHSKELFGFHGSWLHPRLTDLNWTWITTVAWADTDEIMCLAHQHGARAILGAPPIHLKELTTPKARAVWIQTALQAVQTSFCDGLVFDYEDPIPSSTTNVPTQQQQQQQQQQRLRQRKQVSLDIDLGQIYASLIEETRIAFHQVNPSLQISTCVPWSPDGIDGRDYPYVAIAEASHLLYVMDYDTQSQMYNQPCLATANAPFQGMIHGMERYIHHLGISPSKLVLGVPWYGYKYPCLAGTAPNAIYCPLAQVPFREVNCSDAAGQEIIYADIQLAYKLTDSNQTGGMRRDVNTGSLFFNAIGTNNAQNGTLDTTVYQYWFDDPISLSNKFQWARDHQLLGVGPYVFSNLDPVHAPEDAQAMWTTFDVFFNDVEDTTKGNVALESKSRVNDTNFHFLGFQSNE